jgi:D-alanyl-D-alanine carboxypeptidase/D-alanyl-D-alanine-endopeptidase (penicillin-binding protein 4)
LNPRKPIFALLAFGVAVILALTFTPYALVSRARKAVAAYIAVPASPAEVAPPRPAPTPSFDVVRWYTERGDDPGTHAVLVESADGKETLAALNADVGFNPASLVKLTTSLVSLSRLGKDFRFETKVYLDSGPVRADSQETPGKQSKTDKLGKTEKSGKSADVKQATSGGRLFVAGNDPTFGDFNAALISKELERRGIKRFAGQIVVTPDFVFNFDDKPDESAQRLAQSLKLNPKNVAVGDAPAGEPAFVVRSYPLHDILLYMNAHSSNFVAEHLGAMVGGPDGVRSFLVNELKLPPEQVSLSTTSGLQVNRLTPRGLVAVIRALDAEATRQGLQLADIMAVASDDYGTLRRRLVGSPLGGAVVAKTGTLVHDDGGMASLGGVVYTQRFGKVYFVIFNTGSSVAEHRQLTDQLLSEIILSSDTPAPLPMPDKPRHMLESADLSVSDR